MGTKVHKTVHFQRNSSQELTKSEQEVLLYLTSEFLTVNQIAIRRKTTKRAVYKTLSILKKKGMINNNNNLVHKKRSTLVNHHPLRLHGEEYNIKILYKDQRYKNILNKCNILTIDGNTIRLYKDSLEIYSGQMFYGDDMLKVNFKAVNYWNKFIVRLQNDLKIILIKSRSQNIKRVNAHYAEINNELAVECNNKCEKIRIYTNDTGKLWCLMDKSWSVDEIETVHPQTSKRDMGDVIKPFFNDLRDRDHIPLSELSHTMADTAKQVNEISHGLKIVVDYLKLGIPKDEDYNKKLPDYFG